MTERRVVEFGDTRYEFVDGHWWPDVTPQERALVEELERQQAGMRQLLADRESLAAAIRELAELAARFDHQLEMEFGTSSLSPLPADAFIDDLPEPHRTVLRRVLGGES